MIKELVVSKSVLRKQYETMKVDEILEYYGICRARLYKLLDELSIPRRVIRAKKSEYKRIIVKE